MEQVASVLPYLACPLGMGVMMWLMMRGHKSETADSSPTPVQRAAARQPERQAQAERLVAADGPREQQLAELKVHLAATQAQQEAIAHQIARLEADDTAAEAEEIARAASEHGRTGS